MAIHAELTAQTAETMIGLGCSPESVFLYRCEVCIDLVGNASGYDSAKARR